MKQLTNNYSLYLITLFLNPWNFKCLLITSALNTVSYYYLQPLNKTEHQIKQFDPIQHFHYKVKKQLRCGNELVVPPDFLLEQWQNLSFFVLCVNFSQRKRLCLFYIYLLFVKYLNRFKMVIFWVVAWIGLFLFGLENGNCMTFRMHFSFIIQQANSKYYIWNFPYFDVFNGYCLWYFHIVYYIYSFIS